MIEECDWRLRAVESAARRRDDHLLAAGQTLGALFRIAERLARDGEPIDPGLELARNGEVVHRSADHDDVGCQKFVQRRLPGSEVLLQRHGLRHRALGGGEMGARKVPDRRRRPGRDRRLQGRDAEPLSAATISAESCRLTESGPRILESTCKSFMCSISNRTGWAETGGIV